MNRFGDGTRVVGVHVQAQRPVEQPAHALVPHVRHRATGRRGVGLGLAEEPLDLMLLLVVRLPALDVHLAVAAVAVVGGRPVQVNPIHHHHGGVFPVPPVEMDDPTGARDHPAAGRDLAHQHPVGAHRGRNFTVCVECDHRPNVRAERAHLVLVLGGPHRANLLKAQGGVGHDEAGVQVLSGGVHDVVVLLAVHLEAAADVIDFAVAKAHRAILQHVARAQVGRGAQNQHGTALFCPRGGLGPRRTGAQRQGQHGPKQGGQINGFHRSGCRSGNEIGCARWGAFGRRRLKLGRRRTSWR